MITYLSSKTIIILNLNKNKKSSRKQVHAIRNYITFTNSRYW